LDGDEPENEPDRVWITTEQRSDLRVVALNGGGAVTMRFWGAGGEKNRRGCRHSVMSYSPVRRAASMEAPGSLKRVLGVAP